jgi:hypothetical protein
MCVKLAAIRSQLVTSRPSRQTYIASHFLPQHPPSYPPRLHSFVHSSPPSINSIYLRLDSRLHTPHHALDTTLRALLRLLELCRRALVLGLVVVAQDAADLDYANDA